MSRSNAKNQRILRGWIKWSPVLAIPFSILFFHAWINIQILRADYTLRELDAEARELADRLNDTDVAKTIHEDPDALAAAADLMAFVDPRPGQREIIPYDPAQLPKHPDEASFAVARLDTPDSPEPVAPETQPAWSDTAALPVASPPAPPAAAPDAAVAPATAEAPAVLQDGATTPMVSTPVLLEIDPSLESIAAPDTGVALDETTTPTPVLEQPSDAPEAEPLNLLDAEMGSLESL